MESRVFAFSSVSKLHAKSSFRLVRMFVEKRISFSGNHPGPFACALAGRVTKVAVSGGSPMTLKCGSRTIIQQSIPRRIERCIELFGFRC
jgi:hypothetical protein